jgi:hypothetical protein
MTTRNETEATLTENPETESTEATRDVRDHELVETVGRAVETLFDVGRLWASHGLGVGRSALETSALTLRKTASLLGELSDGFRPREDEPREAAKEPSLGDEAADRAA